MSGLSEHDVVLGFETNLDISIQVSRCRLNGRVGGITYIYLCVLKTLGGTKMLQLCIFTEQEHYTRPRKRMYVRVANVLAIHNDLLTQ